MTPQGIVDTAIAENLQIIAITDHNRIGNVNAAVEYAKDKSIFVVPGVELSTPQGHLLVYFEAEDQLRRFMGKLDFCDEYKACHDTMYQCLQKAVEYDGIGVAAHIENSSGLAGPNSKDDHFKEEVLRASNLLALEITNSENEPWFSDRDADPKRRELFRMRRDSLGYDEHYELAKVLSSDSHSLGALGRNASDSRKLTRLKMDTLTFDAFKIALQDPVARVRLEDLIPENVPYFEGLKVQGGFLDQQTVRFSSNLTCIIGGRGTGKSTMLETLRCTSGNEASESLVDCEVWPDRASLIYRDESGTSHEFSRSKSQWVVNESDPENGITQVPVESYGQGQTAHTAQNCKSNPQELLRFLDQFVELEDLKRQDSEIRDKLIESQKLIESLVQDVGSIESTRKLKSHSDLQIETLKKQDAAKVVEFEQKLARGRAFREQLNSEIDSQVKDLDHSLAGLTLGGVIHETDGEQLVAGKAKFEEVKKLIVAFTKQMSTAAKGVSEKAKALREEVTKHLDGWKSDEAKLQAKIDRIREELKLKGISLDMQYIRMVTENATKYGLKLKELHRKKAELVELKMLRAALVQERKKICEKVFTERSRFAIGMTQNLKSTVVEYKVGVSFEEGRLSTDFEALLKEAMGWRTAQVPKASKIAESMSPFEMLELIRTRNRQRLTSIGFSDGEAGDILSQLGEHDKLFRLERCRFTDRPKIQVSKPVAGGPDNVKTFDKLSLGQQQSVVLSIMLFSDSKHPLIIDQPEDNLDSEFIYKTFVHTLRMVKEKRQVIIVTHNANIAVLGDAELIVPLRATSERSFVKNRGSIDAADTKSLACTILEGSEQAFKRRQAIYGDRLSRCDGECSSPLSALDKTFR